MTSTQSDKDFEAFVQFHKGQLEASGLPQQLHRALWQNLKFEDFDISTHVKIILDQDEERVHMMATKDLKKHQSVFLIDHAWSFNF